MEDPAYGLTKHLPSVGFDEAVIKITEALKIEGFGILSTIDVKDTLKKKLGIEFKRYVILGACNPPLAHKTLDIEPFIGLLLPCNVIVMERDEGGSTVSILKPTELFKLAKNPQIKSMMADVEIMLARVLDLM